MTSRSSEQIYAETLAVFDRSEHQYEPLTTPEVAEALDAKRRTVYKRLRTLVDRGELETKETGSNSRVWWRPRCESATNAGSGSVARGRAEGERERPRQRYRTLFEHLSQPVVEIEFEGLDPIVVAVNPAFEETFGYDAATIVGESLDAHIVPEGHEDEARELNDRLTSGKQLVSTEVTRQTADGPREFRIESALYDDASGGFGIYTDITDRRERERELRTAHRFSEELVENAPFGMFRLDEDLRITYENPRAEEIIGLPDRKDESDAIGMDIRELPPMIETGQADIFTRLQDGETVEFDLPFESIYGKSAYFTGRCVPLYRDGEFDGAILMAKDISERKEREEELRRQNERMAELVEKHEAAETRYRSLFENSPVAIWEEDFSRVKERLDDLEREVEDLEAHLRNDREAVDSLIEAIEFIDVNENALEYYGVDSKEALFENYAQLLTEESYELFVSQFVALADGQTDLSMETSIRTLEGDRKDELVHIAIPAAYADDWSRVYVSATDITRQKEYERELERQREQLAALDELNDVVRGITEAVIEQSTREEIEQVVCERLAASESYEFAWVVAGDSPTRLQPRTEAGIEGYLDDGSPAPDPDRKSPTRKAVETGEIQVSQNLATDADGGPLSQYARAHGYRSVATIPIVHKGTLYGVIGVHSGRPGAFAQEERAVVGQIGEVVGHAIAALNRKRALLNEEFLEIDVRISDLLGSRDIPVRSHGTITFDRRVPVGDGMYLLYGTAPADDMDLLHMLGERLPHWGDLQVIDETDGQVRFEQECPNPPMSSTVAEHGGYFEDARIEDGTYRATIYFPPGRDVRAMFDDLRDTYPGLDVVSQRQVRREDPSPRRLLDSLPEKLTERQRAALEVGYYGGFFEWPRDMSGEEVAESLGVGASTFHHHVRKGEKKLLDAVFTEP